MVSGLSQAGKAGIQSFSLAGKEISQYVNTLQVFETLCKPYLTAKALVIDDAMIIDGLQIVGGETVSFTFVAEGGQSYNQNMQVFSIKKEQANKNKRALAYELEMIGPEYFGDRTQLVQKAYKNITGTDIIKNIHSQFVGGAGINVLVDSMGLLFQQNSHVINAAKPFKAIDDIRKLITFAQYPTGSTVYFRDKNQVNIGPLEHLFAQLNPNVTYQQKATWGADFRDIQNSMFAIVDLTTNLGDGKSARTNVHNVSAALKQEFKVFDAYSNKQIIDQLASLIPNGIVAGVPFGQLASNIMNQAGSSMHGGKHNYVKIDTQKIPAASVRRTDKEQLYKAQIADAPQIYIKVPIQGGMATTVGKGVNLEIMAPIGDMDTSSEDLSMLSGPALVADLTHEVHNDNTLSSTTMRCVKGGFNV